LLKLKENDMTQYLIISTVSGKVLGQLLEADKVSAEVKAKSKYGDNIRLVEYTRTA